MELAGKKINFLGDSITEGHKVENPKDAFVSRVACMTGAETRNYGVGGTRIARQTKPSPNTSWDADFLSRTSEMALDADIVFVLGGTNDFGHGDAIVGNMKDRTPYTFYGALHLLILDLIERFPHSQIVFATPTHRCTEDVQVNEFGRKLETNLEGYRNIILEVCRYYGIPVLDLWAVSGLQPKVQLIRETYMPDGLHPNGAGHGRIAEKIVGFLYSL